MLLWLFEIPKEGELEEGEEGAGEGEGRKEGRAAPGFVGGGERLSGAAPVGLIRVELCVLAPVAWSEGDEDEEAGAFSLGGMMLLPVALEVLLDVNGDCCFLCGVLLAGGGEALTGSRRLKLVRGISSAFGF